MDMGENSTIELWGAGLADSINAPSSGLGKKMD